MVYCRLLTIYKQKMNYNPAFDYRPTAMSDTASAPVDSVLALVQRNSLTRLVGEALEKMILAGELPPGSKLNEVALAERLGVSRGPLREAFRTLEESGLIRQEKNRGAFVREIELTEAADIYEVRAGLDATAGRLLAERVTPEQLAVLREFAAGMQRAATANDVDAFHALNLAFHDRIAAGDAAGAAEALHAHARGGRARMLRDGELGEVSDAA